MVCFLHINLSDLFKMQVRVCYFSVQDHPCLVLTVILAWDMFSTLCPAASDLSQCLPRLHSPLTVCRTSWVCSPLHLCMGSCCLVGCLSAASPWLSALTVFSLLKHHSVWLLSTPHLLFQPHLSSLINLGHMTSFQFLKFSLFWIYKLHAGRAVFFFFFSLFAALSSNTAPSTVCCHKYLLSKWISAADSI